MGFKWARNNFLLLLLLQYNLAHSDWHTHYAEPISPFQCSFYLALILRHVFSLLNMPDPLCKSWFITYIYIYRQRYRHKRNEQPVSLQYKAVRNLVNSAWTSPCQSTWEILGYCCLRKMPSYDWQFKEHLRTGMREIPFFSPIPSPQVLWFFVMLNSCSLVKHLQNGGMVYLIYGVWE